MNSKRSPQRTDSPEGIKKSKVECSYGEKCYRKNPEHFQEYTHSHIVELLKEIGDGKIVIPSHYKSKINNNTLIEQLELVRKVTGSGSKTSPQKSANKGSDSSSQSSFTSSPSKPKESPNKKIERTPVKEGMNPAWNSAMKQYWVDAQSRMKIPVAQKMEAASPYNIFLTTIKDSKETHNELLSISFPELLDPYFGELESSLQINFMVEFGFLLAQYSITGNKTKPLTLLYGQMDFELGDKFKHFITHAKVQPPSSFGSHHTKMMIFCYTNKSIRVVVSTANLVESDWENRTQGLWISPECPVLPEGSDTGAGESVTNFKRDLLEYLTSYRSPCLASWLEILRKVDMSSVKVFFIASTPGAFKLDRNSWGHLKLAKLLKNNVVPNNGQVIAQCSSIGSLGPNPNSWLQGDMLNALASCKRDGTLKECLPLKLVYPSFNSVSGSYDGLLGGGCLPYSKNTHKKQEWLISYLHDWYSSKRYRTRAPPHIKTYTRVSKDLKQIYYFVLTSANMSKAAWGHQTKAGSLNILSYEAGILMIPQIMVSKDYFPLTDEGDGVKPFSLPYDLPLVPYSYSDVPWFIDNLS